MILSGMNTREAAPEVVSWPTQALKTVFDIGTTDALRLLGIPVKPGLEFIYIHNGRVYLSVDSMASTMLRLPGWQLEIAGVSKEDVWPYLPDEITRPRTPLERFQGLLIAVGMVPRLPRVNWTLGARARARDIRRITALGERVAEAASPQDLADLLDPLTECMSHLFKVHLLASMVFTQSWTRLEQACQEVGVDPSLIVAGGGGIISSRVTLMLYQLTAASISQEIDLTADDAWERLTTNPVTKKLVDEFFKVCGYRGFNEMEFSSPRFYEEPEVILSAMRAQGATDPHETARKARQAGWARVPESHRKNVDRRAKAAQSDAALREATKDATARMADVYRQWCLKAAKMLPDPEVTWLMTVEEIARWLRDGIAVEPETLETRKVQLETWRALTPVETLFIDPPTGVVHPISMTEEEVRRGQLTGTIVSQGASSRVTGRAVVALDPRAALEKLEALRGEGDGAPILITRVTNVAWTAAFGAIGGIITEVGGVGSHAAIVAREYGIPALVNVMQAVAFIPDGATVELDCEQGVVKWHT
jgi:phosphohistidine swiveling domain-containing protein